MTQEAIQKQIEAIKKTNEEARKTKKATKKFLVNVGILQEKRTAKAAELKKK
jgi:hypothetical protein